MSRQPTIEVHIEELVLHGVHPGDRRAIADAIQREIARTLALQGHAITHDRRIDRVQSASVVWGDASGPQRVGAEVARAVSGGLVPRVAHPANANTSRAGTPTR